MASAIHYPPEEIDAMRRFYGGKRCVVTLWEPATEWAHTLDATPSLGSKKHPAGNFYHSSCIPPRLKTFNQLQWMLERKLRQNRHPDNPAEVRENVFPLDAREHAFMDIFPAHATLFLHEDLLAKTLQFERELRDWRLDEVQAGRGDPGRPEYAHVFMTANGTSPPTPHRWHASEHYPPTFRSTPTGPRVFYKEQCPGIDPSHTDPFPVIETLLSIPFSLMYNLPRLCGLISSSPFRLDLIKMAAEVVTLWAWDPVVPLITPVNVDVQRNPRLPPIHDSSRNATFANMRPSIIPATSGCVFQADTGEYVILP